MHPCETTQPIVYREKLYFSALSLVNCDGNFLYWGTPNLNHTRGDILSKARTQIDRFEYSLSINNSTLQCIYNYL